jgi:hypothetical protein
VVIPVQVSATTAFGERWIEQLLVRYNAEGPEALGDLHRSNGASATILKPDLLDRLTRSPSWVAARWRTVVEPQGCELDGWRTWFGIDCAAAWVGSIEGDRLVDPEATPKEPEIGHTRRSKPKKKTGIFTPVPGETEFIPLPDS